MLVLNETNIVRKSHVNTSLTCMSPGVSLQVKSIIESFATKSTQVSLDVRMTFEVTI